MPNSVRVFQSTDAGAPTMSGTSGTLIAVLDACLVDGYGSITLDSVTVTTNVATCTKSTGHGFTALGTVGPVIRMSGSSVAALNADWRITIVSANVFTFPTSGIADTGGDLTGIAVKRGPAGFGKAFSGTNKAVYRSADITGTRLFLRVDDSPAQYPTLIMYETMSDVDTGTGLSPTSGSYYTKKSLDASATARPWILFSDSRLFRLFINTNSGGAWTSVEFGDIKSYKPSDAYGCILFASTSTGVSTYYSMSSWGLLARSYSQLGAAIAARIYSHGASSFALGSNLQAYPCPADNGFHIWPVEIWENSPAVARGIVAGLWNQIHASSSIAHGTIINAVPIDNSDRTIYLQQSSSSSTLCVSFDITGPWR